ncbi:MAG: META domain-containing protein [Marinosulfonomonas sp.]|nr:META domain-containing protein [Marinosulfonomonas sp.]
MFRLIFALPLLLANCATDETISGQVEPSAIFQLAEIDGTPFTSTATISFPEEARISGRGPCNTYSASQNAPYPWFEISPVLATRMACKNLAQEIEFFEKLSQMTQIEVAGDTLILRGTTEGELVFQSIAE